MTPASPAPTPRLWFVLGDQLDPAFTVLRRHFDKATDRVLMVEATAESQHVPSHAQRTTLFLAAMRHYAAALRARGVQVDYVALDDPANTQGLDTELARAVERHRAQAVHVILPGEWRVLRALERTAAALSVSLTVHEDPHFLCDRETFARFAEGRRELVMEQFYRQVRRTTGILMEPGGKPAGGTWNLDQENREPFRGDPATLPPRVRHEPDDITRAVIELVRARLSGLPGRLDDFNWPVTPGQAMAEARDFLARRLPHFGTWQDAIVAGQPWMYHALLSAPLNLKLLDPRDLLRATERRWRDGRVPLNAAEGFVRQVLGWREFIRGVYWLEGEDYATRNALDHHAPLPTMYWDGQTTMACMRDALSTVHTHGFGHHIERLMVLGNYALLHGVHPREVSDWYLGMYVDGIDWVTLPNALGMSQHADGGVVGTKPYVSTGKYLDRMGNHCRGCRFDPARRTGDSACPFTTLYWDFLSRHRERFARNHRMGMMLRNLDGIPADERAAIAARAAELRAHPV